MNQVNLKKIFIGIVLLFAIQLISIQNSYSQDTTSKKKNITVVGTVTDTTNAPLIGAVISNFSTKNNLTSTDQNGRFVVEVPHGTILNISFMGYGFKTYTVDSTLRTDLKISLEPSSNNAGDDVIVTAYGQKQIREASTGSVTTIKPAELRTPTSNLTTALAGRIAGIIAYQPSGQPGYDNAQFFIRGVTTFGYSSSPLILIDNLESTTSDLARLQVDDIESFSILKDAGATALYGSRGANGVILVMTKRGKEGRPNLSLRMENSNSRPTKRIKLADPITFMKGYNEAVLTRNPSAGEYYTADKIFFTQQTINKEEGYNPYVYPANDWQSYLFKNTTNNQRANLNISGGGGVANYFVSASFNQDNGILKVSPVNNFNNNVRLRSYQLRSNIDINVTKSTVVSILLSGLFDQYNGPITSDASGASDLWNVVMRTDPVAFPAFFAPDSANFYTKHILFGNTMGGLSVNPYANLLRGYLQYFNSTIKAQVNLSQNLSFITPGLKFSGIVSTNRYSTYRINRNYNPFYYAINDYNAATNIYTLAWLNNTTTNPPTEYLSFDKSDNTVTSQVYLQAILNYDKTVGEHTISARAIGARQERILSNAGDGTLTGTLPYRNINFSASTTYTYGRKYTLDFSFGYNGSERFSEKNRFGFFPTVGAAWVLSNEKFWIKSGISNIINRIKFRGSYGMVGNDDISSTRFFYLSNVNLSSGAPALFGATNGYGRPGVSISNYPNPEVTWEKSYQTNLAMEFTVLNDLKVIAEVYKQKRDNIYQNRLSIANLGLETSVGANLGKAESKGIDLSMDYSKQLSKDVMISGRGNLTFAQGKYTQYEEPSYPNEPWRYINGSIIGQRRGFIAERLFVDDIEASNSPNQFVGAMGGDIKYRDINKDGQITSADMVPIGMPVTPQITYGFGVSSRIKQFDVAFFFQGNARTNFFIDPSAISPFLGNGSPASKTLLMQDIADNHWSVDNQNLYAMYPRYGTTSAIITNNLQTSTWWMRNGSFLRLKSVEVGYSLPQALLNKYRIKNCRLYASGLNLFLLSKFKTWDVEQGGSGFNYPLQKVLNMGIQININ